MGQLPPDFDHAAAVRRIDRYCEMWAFQMNLTLAGLRHQHPEADERELRRLLRERLNLLRRGVKQ